MEVKIISNNENKLLNRKEITFSVDQDSSTATRESLTKDICKKLNLSPEATIVVRIDQGFGSKESTGIAHSYASKEMLEKYEPKHLLTRISKKAAKGKEGAAEEKKE
jgi:small subunit ribosomal protein S24e